MWGFSENPVSAQEPTIPVQQRPFRPPDAVVSFDGTAQYVGIVRLNEKQMPHSMRGQVHETTSYDAPDDESIRGGLCCSDHTLYSPGAVSCQSTIFKSGMSADCMVGKICTGTSLHLESLLPVSYWYAFAYFSHGRFHVASLSDLHHDSARFRYGVHDNTTQSDNFTVYGYSPMRYCGRVGP